MDYLRAVGRPALVRGVEVERVLCKIRSFHARGMSYAQMERQTGISHRTICTAVTDGPAGMLRGTWTPLVAMRFEEPDDNAWVNPVGTQRRVRALWVDGFTIPWLVEKSGVGNRVYFQKMSQADAVMSHVTGRNARVIRELYNDLSDRSPEDFGIPIRTVRYCRTFAGKQGCAPRHCWDPDTIDDPRAAPEWTGACGTSEGRQIHAREGIPVCQLCSEFRVEVVPNSELVRRFSGEKFKAVRLARKMTQLGMEKMAGLSPGQTHHWESGRNTPRAKSLAKALTVLEADYEDVCN